jgi:hypothetical protein
MEDRISELMNLVIDGQKQMNEKLDKMDSKISLLEELMNEKFDKMDSKISSTQEKVAYLIEFTDEMKDFKAETIDELREIKDKLFSIELITASNWKDVVRLRSVK